MSSSVSEILDDDENEKNLPIVEPPPDTIEWIRYWRVPEGHLPTPINVNITGSLFRQCPPLQWMNFDIYPKRMKLTNTGYSVFLSAKWKAERPYLCGGSFCEGDKYIFSQLHFHWGPNALLGSEHSVDNTKYPLEMQVVFFKHKYLSQEKAFEYSDGVVYVCYIGKLGVCHNKQWDHILSAQPKVQEAQTSTTVGPFPLSDMINMFEDDYFLYWGSVNGKVAMWIVPRIPTSASEEQLHLFRSFWNPWDEPNTMNYRPLEEKLGRHVFFISPKWSTYASLLPLPREDVVSISTLSDSYQKHPHLIPELNEQLRDYFISEINECEEEVEE